MVFDEMQRHRVFPRSDWDRIGKMPPAFGLIELRIVCAERRFLARAELSTFEIRVRTPPAAVVGIIRNVTGHDAHWPELSTHAGQNLDCGDHGSPAAF